MEKDVLFFIQDLVSLPDSCVCISIGYEFKH